MYVPGRISERCQQAQRSPETAIGQGPKTVVELSCLGAVEPPQSHPVACGRVHDDVGKEWQRGNDLGPSDEAPGKAGLAGNEELSSTSTTTTSVLVTKTVAEALGPSLIRAGARKTSRSFGLSTARARSRTRSRLPLHCCAGGRMYLRNRSSAPRVRSTPSVDNGLAPPHPGGRRAAICSANMSTSRSLFCQIRVACRPQRKRSSFGSKSCCRNGCSIDE